MAMTLDHQDNRHMGAFGLDHLPYGSGPQFSNPWAATSSNTQLYPSMNTNNFGFDALVKQQSARAATSSLPYSSLPATTSSLGPSTYTTAPYAQPVLPLQQDLLSPPRPSYEQGYSAAPSIATFAPTSTPYTDAYGNLQPQQHDDRRHSHSSVSSSSHSQSSYADALDAGRGMVALGQDMTTPRNIYGSCSDRGSNDGYGFPASHSSHSSISSASYTPSYYDSASIGSSASDYGSQSDHESVSSRTLPKPSSLLATNDIPPPQSMMGQFNSKISSSTQKKHKCKICDKRFTRPSSLQTHMYSHTGEKPYACEVEGCGRHFSVVSNLRRHHKVHSIKGDTLSDHGSPEGSWMSEK